jgi:hypothetical protein
MFEGGCCMDKDGNGVCDFREPRGTTTTTMLPTEGFYQLFRRFGNNTQSASLGNSTSANNGFNYVSTSTTSENITAAYQNQYNMYFYRGHWNVGGHINNTHCYVINSSGGQHVVRCDMVIINRTVNQT